MQNSVAELHLHKTIEPGGTPLDGPISAVHIPPVPMDTPIPAVHTSGDISYPEANGSGDARSLAELNGALDAGLITKEEHATFTA